MTTLKTSLILGRGEVGNGLYQVLRKVHPVWCEDIVSELRVMNGCPNEVDILHVCLRYDKDFETNVASASYTYRPKVINICTTVPVELMARLERGVDYFCHSTTRGLHPNLSEGLEIIPKHIGGAWANELAEYFQLVGIPCVTHAKAKTTALLHILNNVHYGVNLVFADEAAKLCRRYGVDYYDYMRYTQTNNEGYVRLGHPTKVRPVLTPPNGKIGGHCVTHSAQLIDPMARRELPLIEHVALYNK